MYKKIIALALCTAVLGFTGCGNSIGVIGGADGPTSIYVSDSYDIDGIVSDIILAHNKGLYSEGECIAEGHIILSTEGKTEAGSGTKGPEEIYVYALVTYGEYGFENGNFTKISGSGAIPTRIAYDSEKKLIEYWEPMDGDGYAQSIKDNFPKPLQERVLSVSETDLAECEKQERAYAESYLKSINREAKIGNYADFEHILPDMNTDASNALIDMYYEYPYWIGTLERLENGTRCVYETSWDKQKEEVTYKKYEYDSKKVLEEAVIDTRGGALNYIKGAKRSGK